MGAAASGKEGLMDFIEHLFGIAPDNGSGVLEFLLFALPLAGMAWLVLRKRKAVKSRDG
jgi:hypothetical protein